MQSRTWYGGKDALKPPSLCDIDVEETGAARLGVYHGATVSGHEIREISSTVDGVLLSFIKRPRTRYPDTVAGHSIWTRSPVARRSRVPLY